MNFIKKLFSHEKEEYLKFFSIISIILGLVLVIILILGICDLIKINEKILNRDFYIIIGFLLAFGLFGSELVGFIKGRIEKYIEEDGKKIIDSIIKDELKNNKQGIFDAYNDVEEEAAKEEVGKEENITIDIEELNFKKLKGHIEKELIGKEISGKRIMIEYIKTLKKQQIGKFSLQDSYDILEPIYESYFPKNNYIKAKIRRLLQDMRDQEEIEFLGNGRYKIKD